MKKEKLYLSQDGSHTLVSSRFGVMYHSKYGAKEESNVVFIDAGYRYFSKENIPHLKVFELGFGTGLNPLLTLLAANEEKRRVTYSGIEAYPISKDVADSLNYTIEMEDDVKALFRKMHGIDVSKSIFDMRISSYFTFNKIIGTMEEYRPEKKYHVIYFDAFAPDIQPELWDPSMLKIFYSMLEEDGILVTYCAKGSFKRALKSVGFSIEALPGPHGKREITRAIKKKNP